MVMDPIMKGFLVGQCANVVKAAIWWTALSPLVFSVVRLAPHTASLFATCPPRNFSPAAHIYSHLSLPPSLSSRPSFHLLPVSYPHLLGSAHRSSYLRFVPLATISLFLLPSSFPFPHP